MTPFFPFVRCCVERNKRRALQFATYCCALICFIGKYRYVLFVFLFVFWVLGKIYLILVIVL